MSVSAAALAQALRSEACGSHDMAANNSSWRRAPPVGIGTTGRPGDESSRARLCVSVTGSQ